MLSVRRATVALTSQQMQVIEFLSTPSARRATIWQSDAFQLQHISIHALREEGDGLNRIA